MFEIDEESHGATRVPAPGRYGGIGRLREKLALRRPVWSH